MDISLLVILGFLVFGACAGDEDSLLVHTSKGDIRGKRLIAPNGKPVYAFLGIPFGKSTAGEARFLPSVPVDSWSGVYEADTMPNACPQRYYPGSTFIPAMKRFHITVPMSEDCLYLNMWVPENRTNSMSTMAFFHGGGYGRGTISFPSFNGQTMASEGGVIVVTLNYRLTSLGFLYLNDKELPGNAGLYDQQLGLRWIKDNIAAFGGNPDSITVFGQSAGGTSVGFLLLAEPHDLFRRAILQSASVTAYWGSMDKELARNRTLDVARQAGCFQDPKDFAAITRCLRSVDPVTLVEAEPVVPEEEGHALRPVRDGLLVPIDPASALLNISFSGREILLGSNSNEGTIALLFQMPFTFSMLRDDASLETKEMIRFLSSRMSRFHQTILDAVVYQYTNFTLADDKNEVDFSDANTKCLDGIIGDRYFTCPMLEMASKYTGGDVYVYRYAHRASVCSWPKWMNVYHSHENEMIFGEPLDPSYNYTQEDKNFSRKMIRLWTNFAKNGKPTVDGEKQRWPKHTSEDQEYAILNPGPELKISRGLRRKYCYFWDKYIPKLTNNLERKARSVCRRRVENQNKDVI